MIAGMTVLEDLLEVKNLYVHFDKEADVFTAVNNISFKVEPAQITCIIGQSGSGKSLTALSMINMAPPSARISGSVLFKGRNLLETSPDQLRKIRGKHIFSIFQNPMNALNPNVKIGRQLFEIAQSHGIKGKTGFFKEISDILKKMNFENPQQVLKQYPFQLSGGMLQRVIIALAIHMKPDVIVADEPTTALDVTVQKEILGQFNAIRNKYGIAILFITHDMGVVAEIADEVIVMKEGKLIEQGNVFSIFNNPQEGYTKSLLTSNFENEVLLKC